MRFLPGYQQITPGTPPEGDPLAGLRDIHLPAEPSWWPPAPGWWLAAILLLLLCWMIRALVIRWQRRNHPYRALLVHTKLLREQECDIHTVSEISVLLRRVAVMRFGRQKVAKLYGDEWLDFLNRTSDGNPFSGPIAKLLSETIYRALPESSQEGLDTSGKLQPQVKESLLDAVENWARTIFRNSKEVDRRLNQPEVHI